MYFTYNKLKRKPWSKSKAKKVFNLREDCINNNLNNKLLNNKILELRELLSVINNNIDSMKRQSDLILSRLPEDNNQLIEDITISSLYDCYCYEKHNFVARAQFTDYLNLNNLNKEITKKEKEKDEILSLLKELEVNLLQNKIDGLLGLLEDEYQSLPLGL
jgi:hypothetical protein